MIDVGSRVKRYREEVGLTQADLASAANLERSALAKVETGRRKVSALELADLARALGVRIEWLVNPGPDAIVAHRESLEPGSETSAIDRRIELLVREVEFVIEHDESLGHGISVPTLDRPRSKAEVDDAANRTRQLLGLTPDEPAVDLARLFGKVGLFLFSFDLGADTAQGASVLLASGGVALVNGHRHVGQRRLSAAHELGHLLFADDYTIDWPVSDDQRGSKEALIDRFARALLLPGEALLSAWRRGLDDDKSLREVAVVLASEFRVDMTTLATRSLDIGAISASQADEVRRVRTGRADIVELDLLVHDELAPPALPVAYEEAVLRLYRHEAVSEERALGLLLGTWGGHELPDLPVLPEDAVWSFTS